MRIRFERTGGYANVPLRAELDSGEMSPARAQELERLVEKARPFDQPPQAASKIPDDLHYEITIENDAGASRTLHIGDAAAPDELKLLLDFLGDEALKKLKRTSGG
jgi:emfourin